MTQRIAHCHKRIRDVARELAGATYDMVMAADNFVYATWKRQHPEIADSPRKLRLEFVNKNWGKHIDAARTTLGLMLREPIDDKVKEDIVTILAQDQTLIRGRRNPAVVAGVVTNKE